MTAALPVLGLLGLGAMGIPMVERLLDRGHDVVVWNRTAGRCDDVVARATPVANPGDAMRRCEVIGLCLPAAPPSRRWRSSCSPDARARCVVDFSTIDPAVAVALSDRARAHRVGWIDCPVSGGLLGDRIGRVRTFQIGYVALAVWAIPMWSLIDSGSLVQFFIAAVVMAAALGLSYGPQAALYAEMFPANVRYSGVSIGYSLGSILGGAFAATIAQWLIATYGKSWLIGVYIAILSVISLIAVSLVKRVEGIDLNVADGAT